MFNPNSLKNSISEIQSNLEKIINKVSSIERDISNTRNQIVQGQAKNSKREAIIAETEKDIEKIARLARLDQGDEEQRRRMAGDLRSILRFARKVADAAADESIEAGYEKSVLREDVPVPGLDREDVLSAAPSSAEGYITVPRVVEEGE